MSAYFSMVHQHQRPPARPSRRQLMLLVAIGGALLLAAACGAPPVGAAVTSLEVPQTAPAPERLHLAFRLSSTWDQSFDLPDGEEMGEYEARVGEYVTASELAGEGRCEVELQSNALAVATAPALRGARLVGRGTSQLLLPGESHSLLVASTGEAVGRHWYLGHAGGGKALAVVVQDAPAQIVPSRYRYIVAEYGIKWKAYREPIDVYRSRASTALQRRTCARRGLGVARDTLVRVLGETHVVRGKAKPGRRRKRYEEPECVARKCKTLVAGGSLVLYGAEQRSFLDGVYSRTFARWLPSSRTIQLGGPGQVEDGPTFTHPAVAGPWATLAESLTGHYNGEPTHWSIYRVNGPAGHQERIPATLHGRNDLASPSRGVTDLIVTPDGAIGWIIVGPEGQEAINSVYYLAPDSKTPALLAQGTGVRRGSLTVSAGKLQWSESGAAREAPIG